MREDVKIEKESINSNIVGDYEYTVVVGIATITKYHGEGGVITIPSRLGGYCTCAIGHWAFDKVSHLSPTTILIPSSVTNISIGAFDQCFSLTRIEVNEASKDFSSIDGVLYNKDRTILLKCPSNRSGSVTIPNSVTSIESFAFECAFLSSINFLGLVSPTEDSSNWDDSNSIFKNKDSRILGHAFAASNFTNYRSVIRVNDIIEYNNRIWAHDLHSVPSTFNVVEAFLQYNPKLNTFILHEENNHLFSFSLSFLRRI